MKILSGFIIPFILVLQTTAQDGRADTVQASRISGTVVSRMTNTPLEGVEIIVSRDNENFYSDEEGAFSIPFPGEETWITFGYPGYSSKELLITGPGNYEIVLSLQTDRSTDSKTLDYFGEIVKYKNGAFDYFSSDQVLSRPQNSPGLLMQGRLSGVSATALSGLPGEGASINIRGLVSLFASQNPLVIVDGMPYNYQIFENQISGGTFHNPLKNIDVNDIQSIEVLKDGGALYGVRGSGGLIVITTRHPESVTTKVNFSAHTGVTMQPVNLNVLGSNQYKTYLVNQLQNSGQVFSEILQENPWVSGNPSYYYYYNYDNETDWQNEIFRPAYTGKFNVNLEGGDEIARFAVMLGYLDQQGTVENTRYQRYNFRLNSDIRILQKLSMISHVGFSYNVSALNNFSVDHTLNPILAALLKGPIFGPYLRDNQGNRISIFSDSDEYGFSNPAVIINKSLSNSLESDLFTNLKLLYQPTGHLHISNTTNVSFNNIRDNAFIPDYGIADIYQGELYNSAIEGVYKYFSVANETKAEWNKSYSSAHFFNIQGGIRIITRDEIFNQGSVYNTPTDEFKSLSSVSLVENTYIDGASRRENNSDLFVYSGYRFKDKYLVDVVLTLSGTSNAGREADAISFLGGKWGLFPSVHGAWLISSEPFLRSSDVIDLLKLRASYSVSGNDFFLSQHAYAYSSRTYDYYTGVVRSFVPNQSLKWEQVNQVNAGIDLQMLDESLGIGIDLFSRATEDLLVYREIPEISGFSHVWENNGTLQTRGLDLKADVVPLRGSLQLTLGGNLSLSRSRVDIDQDIILDVPGAQVIIRDNELAYSFYGMTTEGIYTTQSEAASAGLTLENGNVFRGGDVKFSDQVKDGVINDKDRVIIGNMIPTTRAGIYISLKYRSFNLYALAEYTGGNDLYNYTRMKMESFSGLGNQSIAAYYAWKNDEDPTDIPRLAYGDPSGNASFSERWIEDGAFFRLRELTLSYEMPRTILYKNLRIYVTGLNIFTLTDYLGYYPELLYSGNPAFQSIDYGKIPVTPQFLLGIQMGF